MQKRRINLLHYGPRHVTTTRHASVQGAERRHEATRSRRMRTVQSQGKACPLRKPARNAQLRLRSETVSKLIQDELTHLAMSRQRKYQLRMKRQGRCTVCGKPAAQESRSFCLKHLMHVRERRRQKRGFQGLAPNTPGHNPQSQGNGGESATSGVKTPPVRFEYQTEGVEVTASVSGRGEITRPGLTTLLQTFLTTLTWMCSSNCSSTEGWLTLTLSDKRSLWRVARSAGDSSSLRLIPISGKIPAVLRSATGCFGNPNDLPDRQPAVVRRSRLGFNPKPSAAHR